MTITTKRVLYSVFFAIFFISAPFILLYAGGYRLNPKKLKFEKTGTLVIEVLPRGTTITLNGTVQTATSPDQIRYLLPNRYALELSYEGYRAWQTEVSISSGRATFVKGVRLIAQAEPDIEVPVTASWFAALPHTDQLLYAVNAPNKVELFIYRTDRKISESLRIFPAGAHLSEPKLSSTGERALFSVSAPGSFEFFLYNGPRQTLESLSQKTRQFFETISWSGPGQDALIGVRQNVLYHISTETYIVRPLFSDVIEDAVADEAHIFYLSKIGAMSYVNRVRRDDVSELKKIKLPGAGNFSLMAGPRSTLLILNPADKKLYLIDRAAFNAEDQGAIDSAMLLTADASTGAFSDDQLNLLYINDFELWVYNLTDRSQRLITRLSTPLNQARWALQGSHLIYQTENTMAITENTGDYANHTYELGRFQGIENFYVTGKNQDQLFISGKLNDIKGIYLIPLDR